MLLFHRLHNVKRPASTSFDRAAQHLCLVVQLCRCLLNVGTVLMDPHMLKEVLLFTQAFVDGHVANYCAVIAEKKCREVTVHTDS